MSEAQLQTLWSNGAKAWADVPNASQWVDEMRGNVDYKRMSDTPRTDAIAFWDGNELAYSEKVSAFECRQLERELNAANERIKQLERDNKNLIETLRYRDERINRLIDSGDILCAMSDIPTDRHRWNVAKQ